mgnify:CR=1 FL=1
MHDVFTPLQCQFHCADVSPKRTRFDAGQRWARFKLCSAIDQEIIPAHHCFQAIAVCAIVLSGDCNMKWIGRATRSGENPQGHRIEIVSEVAGVNLGKRCESHGATIAETFAPSMKSTMMPVPRVPVANEAYQNVTLVVKAVPSTHCKLELQMLPAQLFKIRVLLILDQTPLPIRKARLKCTRKRCSCKRCAGRRSCRCRSRSRRTHRNRRTC